ncbi:MAG: HK97-gp10 family putative phage morphogenesis protein [Desulfobacterales bacterium]
MAGEVEGMAELSRKLAKLGAEMGVKTLRSAAKATTTPILKEMTAAIPVGKKEHRTHKGRLVGPGFAQRSIKRISRVKKGVVTVIIGVKSEAFYAVQFVDPGTKKMTARRWFKIRFIKAVPAMERRFTSLLRIKVLKAIR